MRGELSAGDIVYIEQGLKTCPNGRLILYIQDAVVQGIDMIEPKRIRRVDKLRFVDIDCKQDL